MKISNRQRQEIEWLTKSAAGKHPAMGLVPVTEDHVAEFINLTVHGIKREGHDGQRNHNPLFVAKRGLDMMVKMWTEDLQAGIVGHRELRDGSEYLDRVIDGILGKLPAGIRAEPEAYQALCGEFLGKGWQFRGADAEKGKKARWMKHDPGHPASDHMGWRDPVDK